MIGSFWNLCRACPSMPVDKLHSEYRSTYKWHEYTGPRQDVVRRAPQPGASANGNAPKLRPTRSTEEDGTGSTVEPALPRRKKHPELAYRTHEIIDDRARSEERGSGRARPARRSKSEGPPQSEYRLQFAPADRDRSDSDQEDQDMDEKKEELNEENAEEKKEENKDDMKEEVKWEESKKEDLKSEELKKDLPRTKREYLIRHHLERTTGASDGALLPSPTREKLEPVLPRPKDEEAQNKSPQKSSPKFSPRAVRSHSVGTENRSPKRMLRGPSSVAPVHNGVTQPEKRPRPSAEPEKKDDDSLHEVVTQVKDEAEPAVVKSPPEPTRVKSPEQIIMRSPEPVNWTVPLDTGKTFTVTQNVHEGELINRPHSEVKAWTPPAVPPPAPQSAPPELAEQEQPLSAGWNPETSEIHCRDKDETVNGLEDSSTDETQIKCLGTEDTSVVEPSVPIVSPSSGRSLASDVLEKARTRFDQFWGKGKDSPDREGKV